MQVRLQKLDIGEGKVGCPQSAALTQEEGGGLYSFEAIFAMAFSTSEASTRKCSARRAKCSCFATSVALEAILVNSAACSRSFANCACISSMRVLLRRLKFALDPGGRFHFVVFVTGIASEERSDRGRPSSQRAFAFRAFVGWQ